jgi:hypothetical protein
MITSEAGEPHSVYYRLLQVLLVADDFSSSHSMYISQTARDVAGPVRDVDMYDAPTTPVCFIYKTSPHSTHPVFKIGICQV